MLTKSLLFLLATSLTLQASDNDEWTTRIKAFFGFTVQSNEYKPDYKTVERKVHETINRSFGYHPDPEIKDAIKRAKNNLPTNIYEQIKSDPTITPATTDAKVRELTYSGLKEFIADEGQGYAQKRIEELRHQPINLNRISDQQASQYIKNVLYNTVDNVVHDECYKGHFACLKRFAGKPLREHVNNLVDKEYGIQVAQPMVPSQQIAGQPRPAGQNPAMQYHSHKEEIYEIYPDFSTTERNKQYFENFDKKKKYREDSCIICQENFMTLKKRINLFCGHTLCASCLFGMMYMRKDVKCPICREEIFKQEFSVNYMQPHIDLKAVKEQFPGFENLQKIRHFFPWA